MKADAIVVGQASRLPSGQTINPKSDEDGRMEIENWLFRPPTVHLQIEGPVGPKLHPLRLEKRALEPLGEVG